MASGRTNKVRCINLFSEPKFSGTKIRSYRSRIRRARKTDFSAKRVCCCSLVCRSDILELRDPRLENDGGYPRKKGWICKGQGSPGEKSHKEKKIKGKELEKDDNGPRCRTMPLCKMGWRGRFRFPPKKQAFFLSCMKERQIPRHR